MTDGRALHQRINTGEESCVSLLSSCKGLLVRGVFFGVRACVFVTTHPQGEQDAAVVGLRWCMRAT